MEQFPIEASQPSKDRQNRLLQIIGRNLYYFVDHPEINPNSLNDDMDKAIEFINAELIVNRQFDHLIQNFNDFYKVLGNSLKNWGIQWKITSSIDFSTSFLIDNEVNLEFIEEIPGVNISDADYFQAGIIEIMANCQKSSILKGDQEYVAIRRFLIENPVVSSKRLRNFCLRRDITNVSIITTKLYRSLSESEYDEDQIHSCSYCGRVIPKGRVFNCSKKCKENGLKLHTINRGNDEWLMVRTGVLHSIVIPGKPELKLFNLVHKIQNKNPLIQEVNLWPNYDQVDIEIVFSNNDRWGIDIKDRLHPENLSSTIQADYLDEKKTNIRNKYDRFFYIYADYLQKNNPTYPTVLQNQLSEILNHLYIFSISNFTVFLQKYMEELIRGKKS